MNTRLQYLINENIKSHRRDQSHAHISEFAKKNAAFAKIEAIENEIQSLADKMDDLIDLRTKLLKEIEN